VLLDRRRPRQPQDGAVGPLARQTEELRAEGGHEDGRRLGRRRDQLTGVGPDVAHHVGPALGEQRLEDVEVLAQVAHGALEGDVVAVLDRGLVGHPDAEGEAVAGGGLHGQRLAGEDVGVPTPRGDHRRGHLDGRRHRPEGGDDGQGVGGPALGEPVGAEAVGLRLSSVVGHLGQARAHEHEGPGVDADAHGRTVALPRR
jgi:hypothetical protein